jgi:hypothetical protein
MSSTRKILRYNEVQIIKKFNNDNNVVTVLGTFEKDVVVCEFTFLDRLRKNENEKTIHYKGNSMDTAKEVFDELIAQIERYAV